MTSLQSSNSYDSFGGDLEHIHRAVTQGGESIQEVLSAVNTPETPEEPQEPHDSTGIRSSYTHAANSFEASYYTDRTGQMLHYPPMFSSTHQENTMGQQFLYSPSTYPALDHQNAYPVFDQGVYMHHLSPGCSHVTHPQMTYSDTMYAPSLHPIYPLSTGSYDYTRRSYTHRRHHRSHYGHSHGGLRASTGGMSGSTQLNKHSNSRSGFRVFVRVDSRLSSSTIPEKEQVLTYFNKFGRVVDCYLPDSATNVAYVCFDDRVAMDRVLGMAEHEIEKIPVIVTRASPRPDYNINTDRLFVKNVPENANRNDIRVYFEKFGTVLDVYIPRDKTTGQNKRYAFVTFNDGVSAQKVLCSPDSLHYIFEDAAPVQVMPAERLEKKGGQHSVIKTDGFVAPGSSQKERRRLGYGSDSASLFAEKAAARGNSALSTSCITNLVADEESESAEFASQQPEPPRMRPKQPTSYNHLITDLDNLLMED